MSISKVQKKRRFELIFEKKKKKKIAIFFKIPLAKTVFLRNITYIDIY